MAVETEKVCKFSTSPIHYFRDMKELSKVTYHSCLVCSPKPGELFHDILLKRSDCESSPLFTPVKVHVIQP